MLNSLFMMSLLFWAIKMEKILLVTFMFSCNLFSLRLRLFLDRWCRCMIICRKLSMSLTCGGTYINSLLNTVMNDSWFRASHEATQSTHSTFSTVSSEDLRPTKPINAPLSHMKQHNWLSLFAFPTLLKSCLSRHVLYSLLSHEWGI